MGQELIEIATVEERLSRARAALEAVRPSAALRAAEAEHAELVQRVAALEAERREVEGRIAALESQRDELGERLARLRGQGDQAGFRDQSRVEAELTMVRSRLEELDEAELEAMEERDSVMASLAEATAQRDAVDGTVAELRTALDVEREQRREAVRTAEAAWAEVLAGLDTGLRARIEARAKRGRALALSIAGRCSACHMELSGAVLGAVAAGRDVDCESCGAWLVGEGLAGGGL